MTNLDHDVTDHRTEEAVAMALEPFTGWAWAPLADFVDEEESDER